MVNQQRSKRYRIIIVGVLVAGALGIGLWTSARGQQRQQSFTISGVVKSVDAAQLLMTVNVASSQQRSLARLRGTDVPLRVLSNARIAVRGRVRAQLRDIGVADLVTVHGVYRGETFVAQRIVAGNIRYMQTLKKSFRQSPARTP